MRFSVVIPTYQRRDSVVRAVSALSRQTRRDFEVVVAIDGSTDGTAEALGALETNFALTVLELPNGGAAAARNAAAARAHGQLLLFLDDDMVAEPTLLDEHDRSHRAGADMVVGHIPLHPESPQTLLSAGVGRWAERRRAELVALAGEVPPSELLTGQMSVGRETFERLGGFDVGFTRQGLYGGEDIDFGHRVAKNGLRVVFNEAAISHQLYTVDPSLYTRRTREAGRAITELRIKHPDLPTKMANRREYTTRRSRLVFGTLEHAPAAVAAPLHRLAASRVRTGKTDMRTYRLFFGLQTLEYRRGERRALRRAKRGHPVVLAYHALTDLTDDPILSDYGLLPDRFAEQLDALLRDGRVFVDLDRVIAAFHGGPPLPPGSVLVTFDDAYVDLLTVGSPLLAERGIPAVAFVVGSEIGGTNTWDNRKGMRSLPLLDADGLRSLVAKGIAVGAHGWTHRPLIDLDPDELVQELQDTMQRLADLGLPRPAALAYPYGSTNERVAAAVEAAGYKVAFTVTPGALDSAASAFTLPRVEVLHDDTPKHLRVKIATAAWPQAFRDRALQLSRLLGN